MAFRRTALERLGGFDPTLKTCEDYDLWLRAWASLRWRFIDRVLAWTRRGHTSLTVRNGQVNNYADIGRTLRKNRTAIRQTLGSDRPWRQAYASWAADFALVHLLRGERQTAAVWGWEAIRTARFQAPRRAYKYLLEGLLPLGTYAWGARAVRQLFGRPELGRADGFAG